MSTKARSASRHVVSTVEGLPPGSRVIVSIGSRSIGVFNVEGRYFAIRNRCPHQGGELCLGTTGPITKPLFEDGRAPRPVVEREGEIVKCPWHGWEFDMASGEAVFGDGVRVATYRAFIDSGGVPDKIVDVPEPVETYRTSIESGNVVVEIPG